MSPGKRVANPQKPPSTAWASERNAISRRRFVFGSTACTMGMGGLSFFGRGALASSRKTLTPEQVKGRIRGPILTVPTPFTASFAVDHHAVRNIIGLGLSNGVQVYELTAGNSQYSVLSYDEIKALTRTVVDAVGGKGIVIGATGPWWTGQAVDYARFAESVGTDAVQVLLPAGSDDGYVEHFRRIAAATKLAIVLQGDPPLTLIQRLVEIPSIVAMKEDGSEDYYVEVLKKFGRRLAVFCGGQKRRYLIGQPYGSPAFFSFFISFYPDITNRFWAAVEKNDIVTARDIVTRYEKPVFDFCLAGPRPFHAYWRGFMEHFGVAQRFIRPPEESCTAEDMQRIAALCDQLGMQRRSS